MSAPSVCQILYRAPFHTSSSLPREGPPPFYRWGNRGSESCSRLTGALQLVRGRAQVYIESSGPPFWVPRTQGSPSLSSSHLAFGNLSPCGLRAPRGKIRHKLRFPFLPASASLAFAYRLWGKTPEILSQLCHLPLGDLGPVLAATSLNLRFLISNMGIRVSSSQDS